MKYFLNSVLMKFFAIAFLAVAVSASSFAKNDRTDKTTEKAREAVQNASPDDWYTMAKSAKKCIDKGVNLKEASQWLDQSLAIKETSFNLKVKGDYYIQSKLPEKALEYYSKSIRVGKLEDPAYMDAETQDKILKLVRQIG